MARQAKKGDSAYNARRREYRAAQRYLAASRATTGATAAKNRALAQMHLENALATYDESQTQRISSPIINLAAEFGIDPSRIRREYAAVSKQEKQKVIEESKTALAGVPEREKRELEAKKLMQNPAISKRVMGGLVDIWGDKVKSGVSAAENRREMERAIFDKFNVSSWSEVLEILERNIGSELFSIANELEMYDVVRIAIQKGVIGNTLFA